MFETWVEVLQASAEKWINQVFGLDGLIAGGFLILYFIGFGAWRRRIETEVDNRWAKIPRKWPAIAVAVWFGFDVMSTVHSRITSAEMNKEDPSHASELKTLSNENKALRSQIARVTVTNVTPVSMKMSGAPWPALNVDYVNAGVLPTTGMFQFWSAAFIDGGLLTNEQITKQQDDLLARDGWKAAMEERAFRETYPGETGLLSLPNIEGEAAKSFRENFDKVFTPGGTKVLFVFIAFKYKDANTPDNMVRVTEYCWWFQGNPLRHQCGRSRTFLEALSTP